MYVTVKEGRQKRNENNAQIVDTQLCLQRPKGIIWIYSIFFIWFLSRRKLFIIEQCALGMVRRLIVKHPVSISMKSFDKQEGFINAKI